MDESPELSRLYNNMMKNHLTIEETRYNDTRYRVKFLNQIRHFCQYNMSCYEKHISIGSHHRLIDSTKQFCIDQQKLLFTIRKQMDGDVQRLHEGWIRLKQTVDMIHYNLQQNQKLCKKWDETYQQNVLEYNIALSPQKLARAIDRMNHLMMEGYKLLEQKSVKSETTKIISPFVKIIPVD